MVSILFFCIYGITIVNSFEIKCLSQKYPVLVNGEAYYFKDDPVPLPSKSIVSISSESFFFLLPPKDLKKVGPGGSVASNMGNQTQAANMIKA